MKLYFRILFIVFSIGLSSCLKNPVKEKKCEMEDQQCDSALLYLENKTTDTIKFSRGGSVIDRVIKPGQVLSFTTGYVEVHFRSDCSQGSSNTNIQGILTASRYYSVKMDRCSKRAYFFKNSVNSLDFQVEE